MRLFHFFSGSGAESRGEGNVGKAVAGQILMLQDWALVPGGTTATGPFAKVELTVVSCCEDAPIRFSICQDVNIPAHTHTHKNTPTFNFAFARYSFRRAVCGKEVKGGGGSQEKAPIGLVSGAL